MGHLSDKRSRFEKTPAKWLKVGGQLADLTNEWADRSDIIAFVGEGAGQGSPACFVPHLAEMEVDVNLAFTEGAKPEYIGDLTDRDVQFEHPVAMGATLHEAMHAKHSTWDLMDCATVVIREDKNRFAHAIITDLEETRIEARGVKAFPQNRSFLRACAMRLVIGDLKEDTDYAARGHQAMSKLMLLTMGRIDAGVLEPSDVTIISDAAEKLYGKVLVQKLRGIWLAAQAHSDDSDWRPLYGLAKKWIELLEENGHDPKSEDSIPDWLKELLKSMMSAAGEGEPGEGEGKGEGQGGESEGEGSGSGGYDPDVDTGERAEEGADPGILEMLAEEIETEARDEGTFQAGVEAAAEAASAAQQTAQEKKSHQDAGDKVFGRGTGPGPTSSSSRLTKKRQPTGPERAAAVALSKALERARYRDRVVERKRSSVPPGRLKMRAALAGTAEVARGQNWSREPWDAKRRYHTEDPELKVGLLTDISSSMRRVMVSTAVTSWVLSEAVRRVQGKAAQVYYGNDVFPTLSPGQHLDQVYVYSASDMTERFDMAFKALNGRLELLGGHGARLLVVVSDLYHQPNEVTAAKRWFERCKRDGVAVIVVAPDASMVANASEIVGSNGTVVRCDPNDPTALARLIGEAAVRELGRASRD